MLVCCDQWTKIHVDDCQGMSTFGAIFYLLNRICYSIIMNMQLIPLPLAGHTHSQYGHCELNYLHFVQLVTMLERILLYERGRKIITSAISGFQSERMREIERERDCLQHMKVTFFSISPSFSYLYHSLSTGPFAQSALLTALQATPTSHTYRITWLSRVYIDRTETVQGAGLRQQQQCWTTAVWCEWISLKIENSSAFHIFFSCDQKSIQLHNYTATLE